MVGTFLDMAADSPVPILFWDTQYPGHSICPCIYTWLHQFMLIMGQICRSA